MKVDMAKEWLNSAYMDIKNIEHIIDDELLTGIVAFHVQQCIEKSFKAFFELQSRKVPKEHSLIKLYLVIEDELRFDVDKDILDLLGSLYIESRYPSDFGLLPNGKPSLEDAKELYEFGRDIYKNIENLIRKNCE